MTLLMNINLLDTPPVLLVFKLDLSVADPLDITRART